MGTINGSMNGVHWWATLMGPLMGSLMGPINRPINGPINGSINGTMNGHIPLMRPLLGPSTIYNIQYTTWRTSRAASSSQIFKRSSSKHCPAGGALWCRCYHFINQGVAAPIPSRFVEGMSITWTLVMGNGHPMNISQGEWLSHEYEWWEWLSPEYEWLGWSLPFHQY